MSKNTRLMVIGAVIGVCVTNLIWFGGGAEAQDALGDAFYLQDIVLNETGTGAQPSAGVVARPGGTAAIQATCSTAGSNTWADSIDVEARYSSDHTWVSLGGLTAFTADAITSQTFLIPAGSQVRTNITDAAGSHSCTVSLAFEAP